MLATGEAVGGEGHVVFDWLNLNCGIRMQCPPAEQMSCIDIRKKGRTGDGS